MSLLPALALAAMLISQDLSPAASQEETQAIRVESQEAARLMLDSPDLLTVYRRSFEASMAKELEQPSDGSKKRDIEPDLRAKLVTAAGTAYVAELRAGLDKPVAAAGLAFAAHMRKYELDQLVGFLPSSGGRKFIAFIYRNALAVRDGAMSEDQAGETLSKLLTLAEQQDLQSAMTPELLEHWKAAAGEIRPTLTTWVDGASQRTAAKMGAVASQITREYLRSKEQSK